MPDFKNVSPGDPLAISADWYNAASRLINRPGFTRTGGKPTPAAALPTALVSIEEQFTEPNWYKGLATAEQARLLGRTGGSALMTGVNIPCAIFDWASHSGEEDDDDEETTPTHPLGFGDTAPGIWYGYTQDDDEEGIVLPVYHINLGRPVGGGESGAIWRVKVKSVDINEYGQNYFGFGFLSADEDGNDIDSDAIPGPLSMFGSFFALANQGHVVGDVVWVQVAGEGVDFKDSDVNEGDKDEGYSMQFVEVFQLPVCTTKGMSLTVGDDVGRLTFDYVRAI